MKKLIGIIVVFLSLQSSAQDNLRKSYQIKETIWKYEAPKDYKVKIDNFKEVVETGYEYLEKDSNISVNYDEVILLSIAKELDENMNVMMVSYNPNIEDIIRLTLKGYAKEMKTLFENGPNKNNPNIISNVQVQELKIDEKIFYNVKKHTQYIEEDYTYLSEFIISIIDNCEFGFVIVTDNESDREKLMTSIMQSRFE